MCHVEPVIWYFLNCRSSYDSKENIILTVTTVLTDKQNATPLQSAHLQLLKASNLQWIEKHCCKQGKTCDYYAPCYFKALQGVTIKATCELRHPSSQARAGSPDLISLLETSKIGFSYSAGIPEDSQRCPAGQVYLSEPLPSHFGFPSQRLNTSSSQMSFWNNLPWLPHSKGIRTSDLMQPEVSNLICNLFCRKRKVLEELEGEYLLQNIQKR